jgi:SWI/SNF-related matrix-associated actin-dependent regulator of chromatin subfamily A member 5
MSSKRARTKEKQSQLAEPANAADENENVVAVKTERADRGGRLSSSSQPDTTKDKGKEKDSKDNNKDGKDNKKVVTLSSSSSLGLRSAATRIPVEIEFDDDDSGNSDSSSDDSLQSGSIVSRGSGKRKKRSKDRGNSSSSSKGSFGTTIQDCEEGAQSALRYWANRIDLLRPFVSNEVIDMLAPLAGKGEDSNGNGELPLVPQPFTLSDACVLRDYQVRGLSWLVNNYRRGINCFLSDEMGLGKTLQVISFIAHLVHVENIPGMHLIVVPLTVLFNWMSEFKKWCPSLKVQRLHSNHKDEKKRLQDLLMSTQNNLNVVVTTYDALKSGMRRATRNIVWRSIILDEGHRVKNENSNVSKACGSLQCRFKLILTGTPVQNNLHESWAMLNFLMPKIFSDSTAFDNAFGSKAGGESKRKRDVGDQDSETAAGESMSVDKTKLHEAHYLIRPMMLRRLKSEVEQALPNKLETLINCPMTAEQKKIVKSLFFQEKENISKFESRVPDSGPETEGDVLRFTRMQSLVAQLRKAANHPYLFPGVEVIERKDGSAGEDIISVSGKMMVLDKLLHRLKNNGHRVVLFSQFTRTLDIICDYLDLRQHKFCRLDGSTNRIMREVLVNMFSKQGSDIFIFCLSTRAGGEGINLTSADTVIIFDSDWNPQVDIQAMARVHRIGQTKPVHVYRLVTKNSVEERIVQRAQNKLYLDGMVNRGSTAQAMQLDSADGKDVPVDQGSVLSVLKFGWNSIFSVPDNVSQAEDEGLTDAEIDMLIDRSRGMVELGGADNEVASKSESRKVSSLLLENQQKTIGDFDENVPLVPIRNTASLTLANIVIDVEKDVDVDDSAASETVDAPEESAQASSSMAVAPLEASIRRSKRERSSRTTEVYVKNVGMVNVLNKDQYTMQEGEPSIVKESKSSQMDSFVPRKGGRQVSGRDYGHQAVCQLCWEPDNLILCDSCPLSFHSKCAGLACAPADKWNCPHHNCAYCFRSGSAAGLLFRCEMCPKAFCEDCIPPECEIIGPSVRIEELGFRMPASACYIRCSAACVERANTTYGVGGGKGDVKDKEGSHSGFGSDDESVPMDATEESGPRPALSGALNDALLACKLQDIEARLNRNKVYPKSRVVELSDCAGLGGRWNTATQQTKSALI